MNIWSHLIASLYFSSGLVNFVHSHFDSVGSDGPRFDPPDLVAVCLFYLGVTVCFALSAIFHTLSDHSWGVNRFTNQLDHLGIVFFTWGTGMSCIHFAFRCASLFLRRSYFYALTLMAGSCALFTLLPRFRLPEFRTERFCMYSILVVSLFVPLVHAWYDLGSFDALDNAVNMHSFLKFAVLNTLGGSLYAFRIPERWCPGAFDMLGQSHHWMHLLVIAGAIGRLHGLLGLNDAGR